MAYAGSNNGGKKGASSQPSGSGSGGQFASKAGSLGAKSEPGSKLPGVVARPPRAMPRNSKPWTQKADVAADKKAGIKPGSAKDTALDKKRGVSTKLLPGQKKGK